MAGVAHQHLEQLELARLQLEHAPRPGDAAREEVHLEIADGERRRRGFAAGAPAQQRIDPRVQLGERERLDQVIVGAAAQPRDPVGDRAHRGEEQHRGLVARAAQRFDDRKPVEAGQHAVDHRDVVVLRQGADQAVLAIGHHVDDEA